LSIFIYFRIYNFFSLKAQESNLDALYWNATLRLDTNDYNRQQLIDAIDFVYSKGLVALSLNGNNFEGQSMKEFTRVIKKNNWLLGVNLANNHCSERCLNELRYELSENNSVIQAVLLRGNEGFSEEIAKKLYQSITAKANQSQNGIPPASTRLNKISPRVSWLLKSWMRLQCEETRDVIEQSLLHSTSISPRTSLSTIQRTLTREHNLRELFRPYSVFSYLNEDQEGEFDDYQGNGDPLILYDLEEENYGNGLSGTRNSLKATDKFVKEPFNPLIFDQNEISNRYRPSDTLEETVPGLSPKAKGTKNTSDWEYWPDEILHANADHRYERFFLSICFFY
jgi:hypothetical protein